MDDLKPTAAAPQTTPDTTGAYANPPGDTDMGGEVLTELREAAAEIGRGDSFPLAARIDSLVGEYEAGISDADLSVRLRESVAQMEAGATVPHSVALRRLLATARGLRR